MNNKWIAILLSVVVANATLVAPATAAMISTSDMISVTQRAEQISELQRRLSQHDLQTAMISLGVDHVHAMQRVAALSDAERAKLASELNKLPAGGSILGLVGAVFVILLILELVGVTDVFSKI